MSNIAHFMNNLWRWKCGLSEVENENYDDLDKSEWSYEFERLMRNRLILGAFRYGKIGAKNKPKYDRIADMEKRIYLYRRTGNTEYLVDIANLSLVEFVEGEHKTKHFKPIDDGDHSKLLF